MAKTTKPDPQFEIEFYEAILRRKPPLRVREVASLIGMVLLVGLMGIAFKNDVERRWEVIHAQVKELLTK